MDFYPFRFDVKRLRPLLQRDLYTDPDVALRELAQNAHDAILRRAKLDPKFDPVRDGKIVFEFDKVAGTLRVSDNGVGMSRDAILEVFRYYGRSDKSANDEVGTFGLGAKSIFATADSFTIHTKSMESSEVSLVYATLEGLAFQPSPPVREEFGTTVVLPMRVDTASGTNKGREEFDLIALIDFCKCVRVPIYNRQGHYSSLISQQNPWNHNYIIHCDGFDIHLSDEIGPQQPYLFYVEGFYVTSNPYKPGDGIHAVAVNLTRKDVASLTMSRDNFIKDEKYNALLNAVEATIIEHAESFSFTKKQLFEESGWVFIRWLKNHRNEHGKGLWTRLSAEVRTKVDALTGDICARPSRCSYDSSRYTTSVVDLMLSPLPKRYLFGRRREEIDELVKDKDMFIIYHQGCLKKEQLLTWLKLFDIPPFESDAIRTTSREEADYAMCTPNGVRHYSKRVIEDIQADNPGRKLFVLGRRQALMKQLDKTAHALGIYAIKLDPDDTLNCAGVVDLRKGMRNMKGMLRGKMVNINTLDPTKVRVAPPEFFKLAQNPKADREGLVFPEDAASACLLMAQGAKQAKCCEDLEPLLVSISRGTINYWRIEGIDHCRVLAAIASELDWKHPYAQWAFASAVMYPSKANAVLRSVQGTSHTKEGSKGED